MTAHKLPRRFYPIMTPSPSLRGNRRRFSLIGSGIVIIIAVLVLFGWVIGSAPLTQILPGFPVMVPNVALSMLALGSTLIMFTLSRGSTASHVALCAAGVFASTIGSLTIVHYIFDVSLGIDQFFYGFAQTVVYEAHPGRMSPHTALTLMAIGPAMALLCRRKKLAYASEVFTAIVLFLAWSAFIGYLFGAKALRGLSNANAMALASALTFLLLSCSTLAANPRSLIVGMLASRSLGGTTMRRLIPVAIIIPPVIGYFQWLGVEYKHFNFGFGIALATLLLCAVLVLIVSYFSLAIHRADLKRRRAEADLSQKEELYRNLVNHGMGLICTHDLNGKILSINPAALHVLGHRQSDIVGRSLRSLVEPALRAEFDAYMREVTNEGISAGLLRLMTRDGRQITFRYHNVLITDGRNPQYVLGHAQDVSELLEVQEQLRQHSITDALTGLYNRRGFLAMAEQQLKLEKHRGTARGLTVLFADMDGLKAINDTHGHEAGNEAIIEFATIVKSCTRSADLVARWGGDEFVIMLIGQTESTSPITIDRIREKIGLYNEASGKPYDLAFSVGLANFDLNSELTLEDQIGKADEKMYRDKRQRKQELSSAAWPILATPRSESSAVRFL
ncbi:hypothetical protein BH24ACI3_BH24ACI3_14770 [soil metagenome]